MKKNWAPIAPTLVKRFNHAMASVPGGEVYAIGGGYYGGTGPHPIARVSGYDPATNAWAAAPSLGTARQGLAAAVLNGTLYALGGGNHAGWLTLVETFTPTAAGGGTWATGTPMRTARAYFGAAAAEGKLLVAGGYNFINGYNALASAEVFDPASPGTWTAAASMATERWQHCVAALGTLVYSIGGSSNGINVLNSVEAYDITANAWAPVANMTTARESAAASTLNEKLYVMGGQGKAPNYPILNSVEYYDPAAKTWAAAASMGTVRANFAAATLGNVLYVTGGNYPGSASAEGLGAAWHECNATAPGGCTVCAACCKSDIADGGACEACFDQHCTKAAAIVVA